jgi:hypothetical protein
MQKQAQEACKLAQLDWHSVSEIERFGVLQREALREAQRYWKRLRIQGLAFKYLALFEPDQTGRPHMHCLIHEADPARQILQRELDEGWRGGFTKFRLLKWESEDRPPIGAITYVTKSMAVFPQGRICASQDYSPNRTIPKGMRPGQLSLRWE